MDRSIAPTGALAVARAALTSAKVATKRIAVAGSAMTALALAGLVLLAFAPPPPLHETALLEPQKGRIEVRFGRAVALAGTAAIVASPSDGDDGTAGGSVHVFGDSKSGWRRVQRLTSAERDAQDRFGQAVAGAGSRVVIGRDRADESGEDAGGAVVLRRVGYHYRVETELVPEAPSALSGFGGAVAIDGPTIVVGASRDDTTASDAGSARVFTLTDSVWKPSITLLAPDGAIADWFGSAVGVSASSIVVGAYGDDDRGEKSGGVYVWTRGSDGWTLETKIVPEDAKAGDWFGFACAIDGNLLAIGAPRDDGSGESTGCVRLYRRTARGWTLEQTLRPASGVTTTWFGYAVALDRGRLLVGAPGDDTDGDSAGAAQLYHRERNEWALAATLLPTSPTAGAQFGASVALHDDLALIGRNWDEDAEQVSGKAWVFRLESGLVDGEAGATGKKPGKKPAKLRERELESTPATTPAPIATPPRGDVGKNSSTRSSASPLIHCAVASAFAPRTARRPLCSSRFASGPRAYFPSVSG
ncbi:MAG: hypothetical protein SGJ09_13350 [Phycisphaerae bacterium]|nr:hypothetical protein [Phycisphaerae bacterium]